MGGIVWMNLQIQSRVLFHTLKHKRTSIMTYIIASNLLWLIIASVSKASILSTMDLTSKRKFQLPLGHLTSCKPISKQWIQHPLIHMISHYKCINMRDSHLMLVRKKRKCKLLLGIERPYSKNKWSFRIRQQIY